MRPSWPAIAVAFAAFAGCVESSGFEPLAFEPLADGSDSRFRDSGATARWVTDQEDWEAFWEAVEGSASEPPEVDFGSRMVIGVFLGERPMGGYGVEVRAVARSEGGVDGFEVEYVEVVSEAECGATAAITYPYRLVTVPSDADSEADVDVRLVDRGDETRPCG